MTPPQTLATQTLATQTMPGTQALLPEESVEELYEWAPCGYLSTLPDGTIIKVNGTLLSWTGLSREQVLGRQFRDLLTPGGRIYHDTHYGPLLAMQGSVGEVALDVALPTGGRLPVLVSSTVKADPEGRPLVVRTSLFDATTRSSYERELLRARRAAEESERRVQVVHRVVAELTGAADVASVVRVLLRVVPPAVRASGAAVWLADPDGGLAEAGRERVPVELAPARMAGTSPLPAAVAFRCRQPVAVESPEDAAADFPVLGEPMAQSRVEALVAVPLVADGRVLGAFLLTFGRGRVVPSEELELYATLGRQVAQACERARLHEQLRHSALHDQLTGLANRALLHDRLEMALARAERSGQPVTVMFLDLDGFKAVNDGLGHRAGDLLLTEVAGRLRAAVRTADTTARLGGDEFALLCEGADASEAERIAREVTAAVRRPVAIGGDEAAVTASVGVVVHVPGGRPVPAADLLRDADAAMYEAKARGKDRHTLYDVGLRAACAERAEVEEVLHAALAGDGVVLHYQPVVDLTDGSVRGLEALCRIDRGRIDRGRIDRGGAGEGEGGAGEGEGGAGEGEQPPLLLPGQFLDVAEERGLLVPLGRRVLDLACAQLVAWQAQGLPPVTVAVNIAAQHAAQAGFADDVLAVLARTGCPPDRLVVELTESALLEATTVALTGLERLRAAGVGVVLDDFGTRYASMHYVQQFPLTGVKVDRTFVAGLPGARTERAIVRAVAQLAADLGLSCTAEGIETRDQLEFLADLGVLGQGYVLARPLDAVDVDALLRRETHPWQRHLPVRSNH